MTAAPSSPDLAEHESLDWFLRVKGGLDAAERAAFESWLDADERHRRAYGRWQGDWSALDALAADGVQSLRERRARDLATVRDAPALARRRWHALGPLLPHAGTAAAVLALCIGSLVAWNTWQRQPVYAQSFDTPRGHQLDVTLPDGSRMRLTSPPAPRSRSTASGARSKAKSSSM